MTRELNRIWQRILICVILLFGALINSSLQAQDLKTGNEMNAITFAHTNTAKVSKPMNFMQDILLDTRFVSLADIDYAQKAKSQKTIAWVLAGTGVALMGTGLIVGNSKDDTVDGSVENVFDGSILLVTGAIVTVASIPFFIMSANNKRKAQVAGQFKLSTNPALASTGQSRQVMQPALGLSIHF